MSKEKVINKKTKSEEDLVEEANKLLMLNKKKKSSDPTVEGEDDSSDEELVVRTGNVPRKWYQDYQHSGYDINAARVIKPKEEDELENFLKKAEDKKWWRNIYDEMNNKTIYISDKDLELIKKIRRNMFANPEVEKEDYFERNIPYQIHPLSNHIPSKKSFEVSKTERKAINRIMYAIKNGFIKLEEDEAEEKESIYDLWKFENTDPSVYHPGRGYQIPKRELPDTDVSYNPPDQVVNDEVKKFSSVRKIPAYDKILDENFERCCDLFMSARYIRKKIDINEEELLPQLPKPEELKPFPTKECVVYKGHESSIRAIAVDPRGKFLVSGDNGGFIYFWDILTAKIIKRLDVSDNIIAINFNSSLNLVTICGKEHIYFIIPPYLEKKLKKDLNDLVNNKIKPLIREKNTNTEENEVKEYAWKIPKDNSTKQRSGIVFYIKWKSGVLDNLIWHCKGDYFATLSKNSQGKSQVYIHSLSRLIHQTPFSKIKGNINSTSFHPTKPYFLVATNSNIFVYNLQKQVRNYTFYLNRKW
jgi:ribosome biogenesis protein ERB1